MSEYLIPIDTTIYLFPWIALCFTIPYMIYQYHKYGALLLFRAVIVYSFILYMMCAFFYIILPLPDINAVTANTVSIKMQLQPFQFLKDYQMQQLYPSSSTGIDRITHSAEFQAGANVLLLVPFGIYMRYYFQRRWWQIVPLSFALSLFYEVTQLTGLYGIYPHPYRIFDVDDLMMNTLGGVIGFVIAPLFTFILPSKEKLNEISYNRGHHVSFLRRFVSVVIDWGFLGIIFFFIGTYIPSVDFMSILLLSSETGIICYYVVIILYFILISLLTGGFTIGKFAVSIRVRDCKGGRPTLKQLSLRYMLLYGILLATPHWAMLLFRNLQYIPKTSALYHLCVVLFIIMDFVYVVFLFRIFLELCTGSNQFFYDKYCKTENTSIIRHKKRKNKK